MLGVDSILGGAHSEDEDLYKLLGCDETASSEQITAEYRLLALKLHPDKNRGDEGALERFQKLQEARDTLTDPERRAKYDQWRHSGICMSFKQWQALSSKRHMTMHWSSPKTGLMLEGGEGRAHAQDGQALRNETAEWIDELGSVKKLSHPWTSRAESRPAVYSKFRNYEL